MATPNPETSLTDFSKRSDQELRERMTSLAKALDAYDRAEEVRRQALLEQQLQRKRSVGGLLGPKVPERLRTGIV